MKKNQKTNLQLRQKMEEHNHTPQTLAESIGVSVQTVNSWLGKRKGISSKYGEKLEALYGESIETLLEEVVEKAGLGILHLDTSIALQPTSDKVAQTNFMNTIVQSVELASIKSHLTNEQYDTLNTIYPDGNCYIWGVRNGKAPNEPTRRQYEKLSVNDVILFYQKFRFYAKSRVTLLMTSQSLAKQLWNDESFCNIYFINEVQSFNLSVIQFNKVVYKDEREYAVMGFKVLNDEQSIAVFNEFELDSIEDYAVVEEVVEQTSAMDEETLREKLLEMLVNLEGKEFLTTDSKGQGRAEQHILRALLYGKKDKSVCECCKREFPIYYMKTAHIKKRKFTNDEEKLDVNIVFALCPTCDIAFENGDIYVEDGYFKVNNRAYPDDLGAYLSKYEDTVCECYNEHNKQYFEWHKDHHLVRIPK
ncbi:helix-turn-helix domain-containing protein [Sporosarcina psychrophila]|uniref:DNA-binding XRE family transcriptional regulator/uncharacterized protein YbaR (Trm112 family) n=1 Tax=Sporosarcina psychrophila TaxID=1476 RepID=A0ABV2KC37_SPOPS